MLTLRGAGPHVQREGKAETTHQSLDKRVCLHRTWPDDSPGKPWPAGLHTHCLSVFSQLVLQMGPSGSGKTTLLDVLAGRKTAGEVKGTVLYAGRPATHQFLRRFTGYVEQFGAAHRCIQHLSVLVPRLLLCDCTSSHARLA